MYRSDMLICDFHVHIYPHYDLALALKCLIDNLRGLTPPDAEAPFLMACLADRSGHSVFQDAKYPLHAGPYLIEHGPEEGCLTVRREGERLLCLVEGWQYASAERLEILAVGLTEPLPLDRLPIRLLVEKVQAAKALPVLPWALGKWLFKRGRIAADLAEEYGSQALWLGDTFLRPQGYPLPYLLKQARKQGVPWLPGSDPLPLKGEECVLGSYAGAVTLDVDPERPLTTLRTFLLNPQTASWRPLGRRGSWLNVCRRILLNYLKPVRLETERK